MRGWCIHGPYGSSRPCRVARLDGVKRRACDDCLVHAAVSHEELLLLSPWKHENKLLGSPAVGGIYMGKLDWKRRFAESSNNSVRKVLVAPSPLACSRRQHRARSAAAIETSTPRAVSDAATSRPDPGRDLSVAAPSNARLDDGRARAQSSFFFHLSDRAEAGLTTGRRRVGFRGSRIDARERWRPWSAARR